jgi:mannose-1-phosphate guanylyltransferase
MLQKTFLRGGGIPEIEEVLVVTNRNLHARTREEISEVNPGVRLSFLLEPVARNTAAAVAAAALHVGQALGEDALMLVLPADHLVQDTQAFAQAVEDARDLASHGKLVTFGIRPKTPETGYGYIEHQGNAVLQFVEKPSKDKAIEYVSSGRFLWNSGMFCFTVHAILNELREHCPQLLDAVQVAMQTSKQWVRDGESIRELPDEGFAKVPEESIDYAVMEKSSQVAVVPCDIGWSDIGSWESLGNLVEPDTNGNRTEGNAMLLDATDCYIRGDHDGRLVSVVGAENLIVVDTPDALLIADRGHAQSVKQIYNRLKNRNSNLIHNHRTIYRPWGAYTVLEDRSGFKIKRIEVKPGGRLSLQMHHHRSEHWIVVSGAARVVNGEEQSVLHSNESAYIPAGCRHRLENPGDMNLVMIEVQLGEYLEEDDIVRFEDAYGRC